MKRSPRLKHRWRRNPEDPSGLFKSGVHWLCSRCGLRRTLSSDSKPAGTAKDRFGLDCPGRVLREVMFPIPAQPTWPPIRKGCSKSCWTPRLKNCS